MAGTDELGKAAVPGDRRGFLKAAAALATAAVLPVAVGRGMPRTRVQKFDVRDYGATGNGRTDDRAGIQAAVDAALRAGGGTVYFPAGVFLLGSGAVLYGSRIEFVGEGERSILRNGIDRPAGARQMLMAAEDRVVEDVRVSALLLDQRGDVYGNDLHSQCVSVNGVRGAAIEDVGFDNICTMAVWSDSRLGRVTSDVHIRRCTIRRTAAGGFSFFGEIRDSSVEDCVIREFRDDAIAFQDCADPESRPRRIVVRRNVCTDGHRRDMAHGTTPNGILVFGTYDARVEANRVDRVAATGIATYRGVQHPSERVRITDNRITHAGSTPDPAAGMPGAGFRVVRSRDVHFADNRLERSRESGIDITLSEDVGGTGNELVGCGGAGLRIDASRSVRFRNNIVTGYGEADVEPYGILVIASPDPAADVVIEHNTVRLGNSGRERHALYVVGTPAATAVRSNDLRGHLHGALGGMAESGAVELRQNRF